MIIIIEVSSPLFAWGYLPVKAGLSFTTEMM